MQSGRGDQGVGGAAAHRLGYRQRRFVDAGAGLCALVLLKLARRAAD